GAAAHPRAPPPPYTTLFRSQTSSRVAGTHVPPRRWASHAPHGARNSTSTEDGVAHRSYQPVSTSASATSGGFTAPPVYPVTDAEDRKSTRLNSSHVSISYAV